MARRTETWCCSRLKLSKMASMMSKGSSGEWWKQSCKRQLSRRMPKKKSKKRYSEKLPHQLYIRLCILLTKIQSMITDKELHTDRRMYIRIATTPSITKKTICKFIVSLCTSLDQWHHSRESLHRHWLSPVNDEIQ